LVSDIRLWQEEVGVAGVRKPGTWVPGFIMLYAYVRHSNASMYRRRQMLPVSHRIALPRRSTKSSVAWYEALVDVTRWIAYSLSMPMMVFAGHEGSSVMNTCTSPQVGLSTEAFALICEPVVSRLVATGRPVRPSMAIAPRMSVTTWVMRRRAVPEYSHSIQAF
jgi:hypothetical protein